VLDLTIYPNITLAVVDRACLLYFYSLYSHSFSLCYSYHSGRKNSGFHWPQRRWRVRYLGVAWEAFIFRDSNFFTGLSCFLACFLCSLVATLLFLPNVSLLFLFFSSPYVNFVFSPDDSCSFLLWGQKGALPHRFICLRRTHDSPT